MTDRGWSMAYWVSTALAVALVSAGLALVGLPISWRWNRQLDPSTGTLIADGHRAPLLTRVERDALVGWIGLPLTVFAIVQAVFLVGRERKRRRLARVWNAAREVGPMGPPGAMVRVTGELARVDHGRWRLQDEAGAIYVAAKTVDVRSVKSGHLRPASDDLLKTGTHATLVGTVAFGPPASPHRTTRLILPLSETGSVLCVVRGDTHR